MALSAPPLTTDSDEDLAPVPIAPPEPPAAADPLPTVEPPPSVEIPAPAAAVQASRLGHWRVWLLPLLLVGYVRFYYRIDFAQPPWIPTGLFVAVVLAQLWLLRRRGAGPSADEAARPGRLVSAGLFVFVFALFTARALWHHDLFPAYLLGESGTTLSHADMIANVAPLDTPHALKSYNLGLGPLFSLLPQSARTMAATKQFTIVFYGLMVAGLLVLLHHAAVRLRGEPLAGLAVFAPVAVCGLTLICARRYKWHVMAFVAGIAVYTVLAAIQDGEERRRRALLALGLSLLASSVFLYHGTVVLVPVLIVMLLGEAFFGPAERRSQRLRLAGALAAALVLIVGFVLAKKNVSGFYDRLTFEVNDPRPEQAVALRLLRNWNNVFDSLFVIELSFPLSVALVVGFITCLATLRRSWLSRLHLGVFAGVGLPLMYTYAFTNADETHFALASILALIAVGLAEILRPMAASRSIGLSLLAGLLLAAVETSHYDGKQLWRRMDAFPHPHDPGYRLTLALRDAQRLLAEAPEPERVVFFLPAGLPGTELDIKHQHLIAQRDYAAVRDSVRAYRSNEELFSALPPLLRVEQHAARVRVYVEEDFDVEELRRRTATPAYVYSLVRIVPHREVWRETIPLRYLDFVRVR